VRSRCAYPLAPTGRAVPANPGRLLRPLDRCGRPVRTRSSGRPYSDLRREDFDASLAYLRGVDREGNVWLPARLREDGDLLGASATPVRPVCCAATIGTILAEETVPVVLRHEPGIDEREGGTRRRRGCVFTGPVPLADRRIDEAFADRLQPGGPLLTRRPVSGVSRPRGGVGRGRGGGRPAAHSALGQRRLDAVADNWLNGCSCSARRRPRRCAKARPRCCACSKATMDCMVRPSRSWPRISSSKRASARFPTTARC